MGYINIPVDYKKSRGGKVVSVIKAYFWPAFSLLSIIFVLQLLARYYLFYPITVQSDSMAPALKSGDLVFLLYPHLGQPANGDIVLVKSPAGQHSFLCRIIAREGERVKVHNRQVFVNGILLRDASQENQQPLLGEEISYRDNSALVDIRPGTFFCLNDNWSAAGDSRISGPLALARIEGKVVFTHLLGMK